MTTISQPRPGRVIHPVRWDRETFDRLCEAAAVWSARDHLKLTVADVIRSGALRRADEILGGETTTVQPEPVTTQADT